MIRRFLLGCCLLLTVAGCGRLAESRLNPFNWFGGDREAETLAPVAEAARDTRPLAQEIVSVTIEPAPGGAILHAVGLPDRQGFWDADLVLDDRSGDGRLIYAFRLRPPLGPTRVSTPASRQVIAATFLSDQRLAGVREIQVVGATNARAVSRR